MKLGSHYGTGARKQLVRPFLSSPVTLFAYLLLVLCGVGVLEWVLRTSEHTEATHDLRIREAGFDQYYSQVKMLSKPTVSPSPTTRTRSIGLLRRQSGCGIECSDPEDQTPGPGSGSGSGSGSGFETPPPTTTTSRRPVSTTPARPPQTTTPARPPQTTTPARPPSTTPPAPVPVAPPSSEPEPEPQPPTSTSAAPPAPPPTSTTSIPPPAPPPTTTTAPAPPPTTTTAVPPPTTTAPAPPPSSVTDTPTSATSNPTPQLSSSAPPVSSSTAITSSATSVTSLAIVVSSSTAHVTTPASIESTIAASIRPTTVSSADAAVVTSPVLAAKKCRHGFMCIFVDRHEAVPLKAGYRTLPVTVDKTAEFGATYAPMIIILIFQSFWLIIYASIKLNEPFHQLAQPQGTPSDTGLLFDFLAIGFPYNHFKAAFGGNWMSWYMVTAYMILVLMMVAPSLAAEAFSIQNLKVRCVESSSDNRCVQRVWTVAVGPVRALQILLILAAVLVLIVLIVRTYRGSALTLKKVNLALIETTLTDPQTIDLLQNVDPATPPKEAAPFLQHKLWALEPSIAAEIGTEHAAYVLRDVPELDSTAEETHIEPTIPSSEHQELPQPWDTWLIPALIILFMLILIIVYVINRPDDSKLTLFFAGLTIGPKFFLVTMSTLLGVAFGRVEYEIRVLTPYRSLHEALDPEPLLARRLHPSHLTQAFASFKHGEWACAFVTFMAGYGINILAMTLSNMPYHPGKSVSGTIACIFFSLGLLVLMAVVLAVVLVWRRGNSLLGLHRWPETLADIYVLMVHSKVPGVQGAADLNQPSAVDYYGQAHEKKPVVTQRTVEVEDDQPQR